MLTCHSAHEAPARRSVYWKSISGRTTWWIKAVRVVQLVLRVLELIGGAGILAMFILMNNVSDVIAWVMRITAGVVCVHSVYAIYHLARPAGRRTPGSSGAYHFFAVLYDVAVIPLYAFGALSCSNSSSEWGTILKNKALFDYFLPAAYYTIIGAGSCHVLSLLLSVWLALMFRRIHKMPPDMNPLEAHLTSRAHKRNKSSMTSFSTYTDNDLKRLSTPISERRRSGAPYENVSLSRPPSIPFMDTRQSSQVSLHSRSSRVDLPNRQYQIPPSNRSPRSSIGSQVDLRRMSDAPPVPPVPDRSSWRTSYTEIPPPHMGPGSKNSSPRNSNPNLVNNTSRPGTSYQTSSRPGTAYHDASATRPSTGTAASYRTAVTQPPTPPAHNNSSREARFTEAWYASESLVARTNARQKSFDQLTGGSSATTLALALPKPDVHKSYEALDQRYNDDDDNDDVSVSMYSDDENVTRYDRRRQRDVSDIYASSSDSEDDSTTTPPHPLRSNPTTPQSTSRPKWPLGPTISNPRASPSAPRPLSEVSLNDRRVSGSGDITDQQRTLNRKSSIQPESEFVAKPYGLLSPGTPPVSMVGSNRQVSSGYDDGTTLRASGSRFSVFGRRNVSGKVVEEGRGGIKNKKSVGLWENEGIQERGL